MDIQEIEKQKMESLNAIVQANLKVSEAKNLLTKLQEEETEYLVSRETKAMERITAVFEGSQQTILDAHENYASISEMTKSISGFVAFLAESVEKLEKLKELYDARTEAWENKVKTDEARLAELQRLVHVDKITLKNDKESLGKKEKTLKEFERKLEDERGVLERTVKRIKEGNI